MRQSIHSKLYNSFVIGKILCTYLAFPADQASCGDKLDGVSKRGFHADSCQHCHGIVRYLYIFLLASEINQV